MAHFYGAVKGNKGEASRQGSKDSGMRAYVSGWNIGGEVNIRNISTGEDVVNISVDSGSGHGIENNINLACKRVDNKIVITGMHFTGYTLIEGEYTGEELQTIKAAARVLESARVKGE